MSEDVGEATRRPVYQRIADDLRAGIRTGEYRDGDRLPGENKIMERYGVARATAREALAVLRNEGLAVARRGSGVYVRLFAPIRRHSGQRLARDRWGKGQGIWATELPERRVSVDLLVVTREKPPVHVAAVLGLDGDGEAVVRHRRFKVDDRPVQLASSYFCAELVGGSAIEQDDTGPGGSYARLAELGHGPVRFRETLRARMPTPEDIEALELPAGTPVIEVVRTAFDEHDEAVEVNVMSLDASCYVLDYDFEA